MAMGSQLVSIMGPQFDLVSFDPRGVGNSTPVISFVNSDVERAAWDFGPKFLDATDGSAVVPGQWAQAQVIGRVAKDRDTSNFLGHVTTDNVARDMLTIARTDQAPVLGNIDKVERLIIDGVLDMEGYYATDWSNEALDVDKTLQTFFDGCHEAGPTLCAFYASSPQKIQARLDSLFASAKVQPVPAYSASLPEYGIVDVGVLRNAVLTSLYTPYDSFRTLAQGLALLEQGDGSVVFQLSLPLEGEAALAIGCGDGAKVTDDVKTLEKYVARTQNISSFSGVYAGIRVVCSGWLVNPNNFKGSIQGNTSFSLLVIGNTADPVTPLAEAKKNALGFPGAVVLTQDSPGHTSFSVVSECTLGFVNQYFQNGTLPPKGTICPVTTPLFKNTTVTRRAARADGAFGSFKLGL